MVVGCVFQALANHHKSAVFFRKCGNNTSVNEKETRKGKKLVYVNVSSEQ